VDINELLDKKMGHISWVLKAKQIILMSDANPSKKIVSKVGGMTV